MVNPICSNYKEITANFQGVQKLLLFEGKFKLPQMGSECVHDPSSKHVLILVPFKTYPSAQV